MVEKVDSQGVCRYITVFVAGTLVGSAALWFALRDPSSDPNESASFTDPSPVSVSEAIKAAQKFSSSIIRANNLMCRANLRGIHGAMFMNFQRRRFPNPESGSIKIFQELLDQKSLASPILLTCPRRTEKAAVREEQSLARLQEHNVSYRFALPAPTSGRIDRMLVYCDHGDDYQAVTVSGRILSLSKKEFADQLEEERLSPDSSAN